MFCRNFGASHSSFHSPTNERRARGMDGEADKSNDSTTKNSSDNKRVDDEMRVELRLLRQK